MKPGDVYMSRDGMRRVVVLHIYTPTQIRVAAIGMPHGSYIVDSLGVSEFRHTSDAPDVDFGRVVTTVHDEPKQPEDPSVLDGQPLLTAAVLRDKITPHAVPAGTFPPAQDNCGAGVEFTYHSDNTWDLSTRADCSKYRRLRWQ